VYLVGFLSRFGIINYAFLESTYTKKNALNIVDLIVVRLGCFVDLDFKDEGYYCYY